MAKTATTLTTTDAAATLHQPSDRVDTKHPDYDKLCEIRKVFQDVMIGVDALLDDADMYLPKAPAEVEASYDARKHAATLNNYLRRAVETMSGLVFDGDIELKNVPAEIEKALENVDKEGNHINLFARDAFELHWEGYAAILVDTPNVSVRNKAEQARQDVRPFARLYNADSIWNWSERVNPVTQEKELEFIVFKEETMERAGRFGCKMVRRYRHFFLENEMPFVEVWIEPEEGSDPVLEMEPKMLSTKGLPVVILGELGMKCPLYDIARKNVEHFQTYSDYKSILRKTCVAQRVIEGGDADSVAPIGGDITIFPPVGAKAYFIEVEGTSIEKVRQSLLDIADDIAAMTAAITTSSKPQVAETATETIIDNTAEQAALRAVSEKFRDRLERVLQFFAQLMNLGEDAGGEIVLMTQWQRAAMQREAMQAAMATGANGGNNNEGDNA